jgi:sarcosine oxidase subunit alpha
MKTGIERGWGVAIEVDGDALAARAGETLASALIASGRLDFRVDGRGKPRGLYCNMGTCCECMVVIVGADDGLRPARACLVDVVDGLRVRTRARQRQ